MNKILFCLAFSMSAMLLPKGASAQGNGDVKSEVHNITIVNGTNPYITFDIYLSASATYFTNVTADPKNTLNSMDLAYEIDFGTNGTAASGTNSPIVASSYAVTPAGGYTSNQIPSNLSGAMQAGYDSRFKVNLQRVGTLNELPSTPAKVLTMRVNYPTGTVLGTVANGAKIYFRQVTGGTGSKWYTAQGDGVSYTLGTNATPQPLPLELLNFTAQKADNTSVTLRWSTANEQNVSHFIVEGAKDAKAFNRDVATVKATNSPSRSGTYTAVDAAPTDGINYYRLRIVDLNGATNYSQVRSVIFDALAHQYSLKPNPATDHISVLGLEEGAVVVIMNTAGAVLNKVTATGATATINLSSMTPGMYQAQVVKNGQVVYTTKFTRL